MNEEISAIEGDGYQLSLFDRLPRYVTRWVCEQQHPYPARLQVRSPEDVAIVLQEHFKDKDREEFVVLFLNTANTITGFAVASTGGLAASIVEPRTVFRAAFMANAAAIICSHNHPSGNLEPSREDIRVTRQLANAFVIKYVATSRSLKRVNIRLAEVCTARTEQDWFRVQDFFLPVRKL